jgi:hypothetical protein
MVYKGINAGLASPYFLLEEKIFPSQIGSRGSGNGSWAR